MSSIPIQTNINIDTTFYSQVPPSPTGYSTLVAQQWISTANLIVDTINGTAPNDIGPLSTLTAIREVSTPQAYISTLNGNAPISTLLVSGDVLVSTFAVNNYLSTKILEVGEINSANPVLTLTLPQFAIVSTITSPVWMSTLNIGGGEISSISSTTFVGKGPGAALGGGMAVSSPTVSTVSINSNNLSTHLQHSCHYALCISRRLRRCGNKFITDRESSNTIAQHISLPLVPNASSTHQLVGSRRMWPQRILARVVPYI